jgi:hypothetical protein
MTYVGGPLANSLFLNCFSTSYGHLLAQKSAAKFAAAFIFDFVRTLTGAGKRCIMLQRRKSMPQRRKRSRCGAAFICRVFENAVFSEFSVFRIFWFSCHSPFGCARAFTLALRFTLVCGWFRISLYIRYNLNGRPCELRATYACHKSVRVVLGVASQEFRP